MRNQCHTYKILNILFFMVILLPFVSLASGIDHHKLLLVSFDGFRWDFFDKTPDLKAFKYLKENGVKAKYLQSVFPTQTSPNHFSIATGLYPESHGVVHNCNYDIEDGNARSTFYSTLTVNEWWDNGAEPIWITAVNQGLKSGGYYFPGSYANISGVGATKQLLETTLTPITEEAWRERINDTMKWFTVDDLDMIALYFEQPDVDTHRNGPDSESTVTKTLPLVDRTMQHLFAMAEEYGLSDDLNIIITSDHGFETINASVRGEDAISLSRYVNQSYIDFQFSYGPLGLIEPKPGYAAYVAEELRKGNPNMKVYLKEEIPDEWHYKDNPRVTSIVVVANPGYSVYPIFPGFHINKGEHGYDSLLKTMRTSYFSIGPSFKKNHEIDGFENIHIYPLMCHLLGLEPSPNNGSLGVLIDSLTANGTRQIITSFNLITACVSFVTFLMTRIF